MSKLEERYAYDNAIARWCKATSRPQFIGGGFSDGQKALAKAAAEDASVSATFALSLLSRHAGPGSRSDHFWEVRRVSGRLHFRLVSPA